MTFNISVLTMALKRILIEPLGVPYHGISSGKLRRYFSVQNFTDPFRVVKGFGEARKLIRDLKPDVIFSKGGFVSVPVVLAAKRCKVPVIIHESDMTPGLANKISIPSAEKVCCKLSGNSGLSSGWEGRPHRFADPSGASLRKPDRSHGSVRIFCR